MGLQNHCLTEKCEMMITICFPCWAFTVTKGENPWGWRTTVESSALGTKKTIVGERGADCLWLPQGEAGLMAPQFANSAFLVLQGDTSLETGNLCWGGDAGSDERHEELTFFSNFIRAAWLPLRFVPGRWASSSGSNRKTVKPKQRKDCLSFRSREGTCGLRGLSLA